MRPEESDRRLRRLTKLGLAQADLPVVVCPRLGVVLRDPSVTQLHEALQDS